MDPARHRLALSGDLEQVSSTLVIEPDRPTMPRRLMIAVAVVAGIAAILAIVMLPDRERISETEAFTAPGLDPLTIEDAWTEFWRLTPALLLVVYDAFGKTEEDAIYDTLADVTHGEALEYLYLERVGAMAGGGLEEADQTIHEIKLLNTRVERAEAGLNRPGFTGGQNSRRIARYGTCTKEEDLEAVFT